MNFKAFLLSVFIIVCGVFIYVKVQSLGDANSYFNQGTRFKLGKHKIFRTVFSLHNDGDARAEYLYGNGPIIIEIVRPTSLTLTDQTIQKFADKVTEYTGRPTTIKSDSYIEDKVLTEEDIENIVDQKRRYGDMTQTSIFIIYATDFSHGQTQIARTYKEFGMILSDRQMFDLVRKNQRVKQEYAASTMLHEFGHQLGIDHIEDEQCVMASSVETPDRTRFFFSDVTPQSFCEQEMEELNRIKARLK
jgi:hypothetical protein